MIRSTLYMSVRVAIEHADRPTADKLKDWLQKRTADLIQLDCWEAMARDYDLNALPRYIIDTRTGELTKEPSWPRKKANRLTDELVAEIQLILDPPTWKSSPFVKDPKEYFDRITSGDIKRLYEEEMYRAWSAEPPKTALTQSDLVKMPIEDINAQLTKMMEEGLYVEPVKLGMFREDELGRPDRNGNVINEDAKIYIDGELVGYTKDFTFK